VTAQVRTLTLALHELPVATLTERRRPDGKLSYELDFERAYVGTIDRPVFSLACSDWRLDRSRRFVVGVPSFLRNLLPDPDSGLRRRLARGVGVDAGDDFSLLAALGEDMAGAITARPAASGEEVQAGARSGASWTEPATHRAPLRFSLGGAQLKFSVDRTDRVSLPVEGRDGRWILKLPDRGRPGLPRAELAALDWARSTGFQVPDSEIVDPSRVEGLPADVFEGIPEALLVRRFDRAEDHRRIHMEELAQVLSVDPEDKYCEPSGRAQYNLVALARVVRRFAGDDALYEFVGRIVFDLLAGNGDGHLKNFAFLYRDPRRPALAPVYDVVPTILFGYPPELALAFTRERAMRAVDLGRFRQFAGKVGASPDSILDAVRGVIARAAVAFDGAVASAGISSAWQARWKAHWTSLPLVKGFQG